MKKGLMCGVLFVFTLMCFVSTGFAQQQVQVKKVPVMIKKPVSVKPVSLPENFEYSANIFIYKNEELPRDVGIPNAKVTIDECRGVRCDQPGPPPIVKNMTTDNSGKYLYVISPEGIAYLKQNKGLFIRVTAEANGYVRGSSTSEVWGQSRGMEWKVGLDKSN